MGNFAPAQVALTITFISLIGAFIEMVREGRASKARRERARYLRPDHCPAFALRGLKQWQYQVVSVDQNEF